MNGASRQQHGYAPSQELGVPTMPSPATHEINIPVNRQDHYSGILSAAGASSMANPQASQLAISALQHPRQMLPMPTGIPAVGVVSPPVGMTSAEQWPEQRQGLPHANILAEADAIIASGLEERPSKSASDDGSLSVVDEGTCGVRRAGDDGDSEFDIDLTSGTEDLDTSPQAGDTAVHTSAKVSPTAAVSSPALANVATSGGGSRDSSTTEGPATPMQAAKTVLRTTLPTFVNWSVTTLRAKVKELSEGAKKKSLRFGDGPNDLFSSVSSATKNELADVMLKRAKWLEANDQPPDYQYWEKLTPEKAKAKGKKRATVSAEPRKDVSSVCRMICLMTDSDLFAQFESWNSGSTRDEQDAREVGYRHRFFRNMAKAMVVENWRSSDGNPISVPSDHVSDNPPAPDDLLNLLAKIDLESSARLLKTTLKKDEDGVVDLLPMQEAIMKWIKATKAQHTEMRRREDQSGGVGTDEVPDDDDDEGGTGSEGEGEGGSSGKVKQLKDQLHTWNFCMGSLPVQLWNDLMRLMAGGDCNVADVVMPQGDVLSGTSVAGGTGVTSTITNSDPGPSTGGSSSTGGSGSGTERKVKTEGGAESASKRRKKVSTADMMLEKKELVAEFKGLLKTIKDNENASVHTPEANRPEDDHDARVLIAADRVQEITVKIESLGSNATPAVVEAYNKVLRRREKELKVALAQMRDDA